MHIAERRKYIINKLKMPKR